MITAKDAKQLYEDSGYEVEQFLTHQVETEVINAAKSGKRQIMIYLGTISPFEYVQNVTTPLHRAVVSRLKELGFHAEIQPYGNKYVPRGLADDDGTGPEHQNFGIHIGW